jgi:hypothetical protein
VPAPMPADGSSAHALSCLLPAPSPPFPRTQARSWRSLAPSPPMATLAAQARHSPAIDQRFHRDRRRSVRYATVANGENSVDKDRMTRAAWCSSKPLVHGSCARSSSLRRQLCPWQSPFDGMPAA